MSGLETAIRNALERSDRASPETRARIYQSARNALETGLRKQDVLDPDVIAQQRHRLETIIHTIETEERAALKSVVSDAGPPVVATEPRAAGDGSRDKSLDGVVDPPGAERRKPAETAPEIGLDGGLDGLRADRTQTELPDRAGTVGTVASPDPVMSASRPGRLRGKPARLEAALPGQPPRRSRRGRLFSLIMVIAVLVGAFGTAAWWAETSGLLKSASERDTGVPNPPTTVRAEDFSGDQGLKTLGPNAFSGDWVDVFQPADAGAISARGKATVSPLSDEAGARVRITSATADADGNVLIELPVSVLEQLSGKTSTIALSVQADNAQQTQFSVECDFASLGDCGRHRFTVNEERADMLFKITFDRSLAPSTPGHILINSDVTGQGKSISVYAVRVLPGQ